MRRSIYYFTTSLDGYIADAQGGTSWLAGDPATDYGYEDFYQSVETILLGRRTYEQMLEMGDFFPYADKEVIVFSSNPHLKSAAECVQITQADPAQVLARLQLGEGGDIWIGGGAKLAGSLLKAGLIDELHVFIQPILLGSGLPFFGDAESALRPLEWTHSQDWPGGITELRYKLPKRWRADI